MALKFELEQWGAAVKAYDEQDFNLAIETFESIADSAKFHFNMGLIYATLGEHEEACRSYKKSVKLDLYFAVSYFQKGVSHFLLGEFEKALANFNDALLYLRGNMLIDYEQLGLKFRLYSCEVLFNRGLCYLYLGKTEQGMGDFAYASKEKQTEEHNVIDEAIQVQGQGFTVFSIPVGVIYRPPEGKLKNVKTKDYLGKAKLVAAVDPEDAYTGFTGAQQRKKAQMNTTTPITNAKTDGTVDIIRRPESPTDNVRPKSLSTNPKLSPFPVRSVRNSKGISKNRPIQNDPNMFSRNASMRRLPNHLNLNRANTINTIENGRPLRVPREGLSRSNSLSTISTISSRLTPQSRGISERPSTPQRSNTLNTVARAGLKSPLQGGQRTPPTPDSSEVYGKENDTRVILVPVDIAFSDFMKRVQGKFSSNNPLKLKYKDEDGTMVSITDQEDLEIAISMIPRSASEIGKMEIWMMA
ncbi:3650_t:CDS:10 [Diversispora eburnea]|uniref:3650_t:CDS:1 n=1 Tax=Diversispora eburnea TaxID=1213867 RepID=A0A9N8WJP8_9GLOM|nr:3650_t:CDS:10 [Diversispora eburnea]